MSNRNGKSEIRVYYCGNNAVSAKLPLAASELGLGDEFVLEAVPCGGKVDPRYILKAFEAGAAAVCILACPTGHCRMIEGNLRAARRANFVREMLSEAGMDPDAVQIFLPASPDEDTIDGAMKTIGRSLNGRAAVKELVA